MHSLDLLDALIAFPTVSRDPNRALIDYCATLLKDVGAELTLIEAEDGKKANLYATIGPRETPGVMLSGHTDVVPVDGQAWTVPAFRMTRQDGKLYGRGSADMKGFVACAMRAAIKASSLRLHTPLHIALSHDEEIGCVGVHSLLEMLAQAPVTPRCCIVGEPTSLHVAIGHKGKLGLRARCRGRAAHSALANTGLNAVYLATDLIHELRQIQQELVDDGATDDDFAIPHTTLHVGKISGGVALNIVPDQADVLFEVRHLAEDDAEDLLARIHAAAQRVLAPHLTTFPEAAIDIEIFNRYPALATDDSSDVVSLVQSLVQTKNTIKVDFGTEGGLFSSRLGIPTVVCGPGSMAQGHKPDEFIEEAQLTACDAALDRLIASLQAAC